MKRRTANCPGCGGPIVFKIDSSLVTVCEFCNSAVARGDKKVEDFGKVADVGETSSGLRLGLTGKFGHKPFTITGRVRYEHPAGGVWDEWYLALPENRWGWLAEAQGQFYLLLERRINKQTVLPTFEALNVSTSVPLGKATFVVREKGTAIAASAEGELPWAFRPRCEHRFVDLEAEGDQFATIEYDDPTRLFIGKKVTLSELGIQTDDGNPDRNQLQVGAVHLNCPQCGGSLTLRLPKKSERMSCPSCLSLLDIEEGKLSYLKTFTKPKVHQSIPLGSEGVFEGTKHTVVGFMLRYALYEGKKFFWTEYLLHGNEVGFRWLVCNNDHWSFVKPVTVKDTGNSNSIKYGGRSFRLYDRGKAFVQYVMGEFYWRVEVGESVRTADFIAPPQMLSFEWSSTGKSSELNVSLGTYLKVEEVETAFKLKGLRRPWGVGPMSPAPVTGFGIYLAWMVFLFILIMTHAKYATVSVATGSDGWLLFYAIIAVSALPVATLVFRYFYEVQRWRDSDYSPYASE